MTFDILLTSDNDSEDSEDDLLLDSKAKHPVKSAERAVLPVDSDDDSEELSPIEELQRCRNNRSLSTAGKSTDEFFAGYEPTSTILKFPSDFLPTAVRAQMERAGEDLFQGTLGSFRHLDVEPDAMDDLFRSSASNVNLLVMDYKRLYPKEWLNDNLIDFFLTW